MKDIPITRRIMPQTLIVIIGLTSLAIVSLGALSQAPLVLTLSIAALLGLAVIVYGRLPSTEDNTAILSEYQAQAETDYLTAQANLADGIADAVTMIDIRQRVVYANPAAKALLNIKNLGRPLSTYVRAEGVREAISQALRGARPEAITYKVENPTEHYIRFMTSPFLPNNLENPRPMALCFFYDMTEYIFIDSQRADFLANASHELKTPVASILGYIETLQGHAKDDPAAREKFLGIMKSQGERMERLISDLLSLLRIEQIEHQAPESKADIHAAIVTAIEAVEPMKTKRAVNIMYSPSAAVYAKGDQDELVQLILNLLSNAVRISDPKKTITINAAVSTDWQPAQAFSESDFSDNAQSRRIVMPPTLDMPYIVLKIRDNGPGFSRDHLPRIGERFYRVAGDLGSREKGTGLGLAIVKHITRRHRGGLLVKSAQGEGTEFIVLIPCYGAPTPAKSSE